SRARADRAATRAGPAYPRDRRLSGNDSAEALSQRFSFTLPRRQCYARRGGGMATQPPRADLPEEGMVRRIAARAPLGFGIFLVCVALSTVFEFVHFPERRAWMGGFATGFVLLVALARSLLRARPAWTVGVL